MKPVTYITDEQNNRRALVIDLKDIEKHSEEVHELIDTIVAKSRRGEETIGLDQFKKELKEKL